MANNKDDANLNELLLEREAEIEALRETLGKLTVGEAATGGDNRDYLNMIKNLRAARPETVSIKLVRDGNMNKDVLPVAVNGKQYWVPRGVPLTVPYAVAEVIERSVAQEELAQSTIDRLSGESRF